VALANPVPGWALVLVVLAAAALAWHAYRRFAQWPARRYTLSALRFLTLLALVFILMRPVARSTEIDAREVVVPILVDTSRSMAIEDVDGGRRLDHARRLVSDELLPALQGRFTVEVLSFGEALAPVAMDALNATGRRTDLAGALAAVQERYRGRPVAGYVLVTDGGDTGRALDLSSGTTLPPIHPVVIGSPEIRGDREVLGVTAAEAVLDGSRVDLAVSAVAHGAGDGTIELRLLENGRPVGVKHLRPPADGGPVRAVFQVAPAAGAATIYTVEIPVAPEELVPENNRRSVLVQPPSRTRRVLLVEGAPGFEHSFLKRALTGDRGLEVDSVVRKGKNEQGEDTYYIQAVRARAGSLESGYPTTAETLFAYDAVVMANVAGDQLRSAQLEMTRDFVARRGGGLLVMGAQSFLSRGLVGTPVEDALPVELNRRADVAAPAAASRGVNRVSLTDAGYQHQVTQLAGTAEDTRARWDGLPALASAALVGAPRPGAAILATTAGAGGAPRPLIAVQRYGDGRSMVFAGEASWRWQMMLPSTDTSYETFWRQSVRWLALGATDPVAVYPPAAGGPGDEFTVRAVVRDSGFAPLRDADVDIRVSGPDGRMETLGAALEEDEGEGASLFAAKFTPDQPGLYRLSVAARRGAQQIGSATSAVLVGSADLEMTDPRANRALLERLASQTGGAIVPSGRSSDLVAKLRAAAPAAALSVRTDLWHNVWSLAALLGLLAAEWVLRRRWGLR
jgi:uncharacterized membrane protein